jgi:hypothetical protein
MLATLVKGSPCQTLHSHSVILTFFPLHSFSSPSHIEYNQKRIKPVPAMRAEFKYVEGLTLDKKGNLFVLENIDQTRQFLSVVCAGAVWNTLDERN